MADTHAHAAPRLRRGPARVALLLRSAVSAPFACEAGRICCLLSAPPSPFLTHAASRRVRQACAWTHPPALLACGRTCTRRPIEFRTTHGSNADAKARRAAGGRAPA